MLKDEYIRQLEEENCQLRRELRASRSKICGWENIRQYAENELSDMGFDTYSTYKITGAFSQILRSAFNLKLIKELKEVNYENAKNLVKTNLDFIRQYQNKESTN